jgi:DNA-binding response OmpR family regulator
VEVPAGNKILIVAHDQDMQDLLIHSLSHERFQILTASDGESALFLFGLALPDLIVLDIMLPRHEEWETLRRLRALSMVPIIVLADTEGALIRSLSWGADYSMDKPFSVRELQARVDALLRRAQGTIGGSPESQPTQI